MNEAQLMSRLLEAAENAALELERLRLLKEHELGVRIEYSDGDPYVKVTERSPRSRNRTGPGCPR
jgi:hypothetical protein